MIKSHFNVDLINLEKMKMMLKRKEMGRILIVLVLIQLSVVQIGCVTMIEVNGEKPQILVPDLLYINEVMADNDLTISDANTSYADWIELYNGENVAINLTGMYMSDDLTDSPTWQFPNDTIIDAGGYLLIWADGNTTLGGLHVPFRLDANGDVVALIATDGETIIDSVSFGKQIRDTSYGRLPDGGSDWSYMTNATPGAANISDDSGSISFWIVIFFLLLTLVLIVFLAISKRKSKMEEDQ